MSTEANEVAAREWFVIAKPRHVPNDGYKYIDRDGPFLSPESAGKFVTRNRPERDYYMVTIYSRCPRKR